MSKQTISKVLWLGFGLVLMLLPLLAFGEGEEISEEARKYLADADMKKWLGLAAGLAMGIAAFGGALGQGRTASAALDGIARNPNASDKLFTPMILGLALIESLVLFGLLIAYLLISKLG